MSRQKVIVTRKLPDSAETRMAELFDVKLNWDDHKFSKDQLAEALANCDILVSTVGDEIDGVMLSSPSTKAKMIAQFGAGTDNIDIEAAAAHNIIVTNTPGVLTEDTADFTLALMLAVPRRLFEGAMTIKENTFGGWAPTWMLGRRIWGKRLGIIGMGRIGQAVARRAKAFGLSIHYHNRNPISPLLEKELEATYWDSLDQMLSRMDIVSIHCPHTPATYHLLSKRRLQLLQPHAYIINTSRGEVMDEQALVSLLKKGKLSARVLMYFVPGPRSTLSCWNCPMSC